jgi:flagellar basal-body rod protein FlgF
MLFLAMNGASQALQAQNNISHNLANISTTGFKASLDAYRNWHVAGPGFPTRVYNQLEYRGNDMSMGSFITTGRDLDVAVHGDGWIAVQGVSGDEGYTRAGDFRLDANGRLTTGTGHPVIGNSGPIVLPPAEKIEIGADGSISLVPVGQAVSTVAIVDRIKLVNPDVTRLQKGDDSLMYLPDGERAPADAKVNLASGVIESSNVNAVTELVKLITNARQYEINVKLMSTAGENDEVSARLLRGA